MGQEDSNIIIFLAHHMSISILPASGRPKYMRCEMEMAWMSVP